MDVRLIAAVGKDSAASLIRDTLRAERIATDTLIDLPGEPDYSVIIVARGGENMIITSASQAESVTGRRDAWRNTLHKTFQEVDAIALPVLRKAPLKRNALVVAIFEARFMDIQNTVAVNYAGVPALALPIPLPGERFPVTSIQLIGPPNSEAALLNIGRLIETKS
jgi:Asp-tRNA(Asn)/Glu-tRNA(Gln) amidotransferase A subunit family amidase